MRRTSNWLLVLVAAMAGFAGGTLSPRILPIESVSAQARPEPTVVSAQEFRVVTKDGKIRARLGLWDDEHPLLILADPSCDARISMGVSEHSHPSMVLYDKGCRRRAVIDLIPDGLPELTFRDMNDRPRVKLHLLKDGSPVLHLFDPVGQVLWSLPDRPGEGK